MDASGPSGSSGALRLQGPTILRGTAARMIVRRAESGGIDPKLARGMADVRNLARGIVALRNAVADLRSVSRLRQGGAVRGTGGGPLPAVPGFASTRSSAGLGLDLQPTFTGLRSTGEINPTANSFQLTSPLQNPLSTSSPTLGGAYDGSQGTDTLTFKIENDAVVGSTPFDVEIKDGGGNVLETVSFGADPPGTAETLSNGMTLAFSSGFLKKDDKFTVDVVSGVVNPDNPFEGTGVADPNLEPGQSVGDGSFFVNGAEIDVRKEDSINDVLAKIDASSAGVTTTFDAVSEEVLLQRTTSGPSSIVVSSDTSGFLDAVKLSGAAQVLGLDEGDADRPVAQVAALAGIASGSFSIDGVGFTVDASTDSLNAILDRINASAVSATAALDPVSGEVVLTSGAADQDLALDDGTSGFFAAVGIAAGTIEAQSTAAFGSVLGLDTDGQPFTTLGSTEEINTNAFFSGPYSVTFGGSSTTTPTVGGLYDGSQGDDVLTFKLKDDGTVGSNAIDVEVKDGNGNVVETVEFGATDPPDTVKTLSNGLTLSLSAGLAVKDETFQIQVASGVVDPDGRFDKGGPGANLESGFPVVDGDAFINGVKIGIKHDDSVNDVVNKINASAAGVIAGFDAATERFVLTQASAGPQHEVVLGSDASGFFAAAKLTEAVQVRAETSDAEAALAQVPALSGVADGTFRVNGVQLTVDREADSLEEVLQRINASAAGVTASYDEADDRVVLVSNDPLTELELEDGTSGLFAALGIAAGTLEVPREGGEPGVETRSLGSRFVRPVDLRSRLRDVGTSLTQLFGPVSSSSEAATKGSAHLRAAFEGAFEDAGARSGGAFLRSGLGVDVAFRDEVRIGLELDFQDLARSMSRDPERFLSFLRGDETRTDAPGLLDALDGALDAFAADLLAELGPGHALGLLLDVQA